MAEEAIILQATKLKKDSRRKRRHKRKKNPNPANMSVQNGEFQSGGDFNHDPAQNIDIGIQKWELKPKYQPQNPPDSGFVTPVPVFSSRQAYQSPRKEALKRHEHNSKEESHRFLDEAKRKMKPATIAPDPLTSSTGSLNGGLLLSNENVDGKKSLILIPHSRIVVYHDTKQKNGKNTHKTHGNLLARGVLEIFQLHNGDVTYMSCGESFVYPLLPKLNILRIKESTLVLPLANPKRYWEIVLCEGTLETIAELENVLQHVVQYTNLTSMSTFPLDEDNKTVQLHGIVESEFERPSPFLDGCPPSPPSVSASPPLRTTDFPYADTYKSMVYEKRLDADKFITYPPHFSVADAHANDNLKSLPNLMQHLPGFQPHDLFEKPYDDYRQLQHAAETSSNDSLLDEYEESISKSVTYRDALSHTHSLPRQVSKLNSSIIFHSEIRDSPGRPKGSHTSVNYQWSNFNRAAGQHPQRRRIPTQSERSRQSSISDLYTSVSNWMEPGQQDQDNSLKNSRSIRSLASPQSSMMTGPNGLFDAYREASILGNKFSTLEEEVTKKSSLRTKQSREKSLAQYYERSFRNLHGTSEQVIGMDVGNKIPSSTSMRSEKNLNLSSTKDGLTPSEVYNLIKNRDTISKPKSIGIRSFFGW